MTKFDERTTANMNVAPENACRVLPNSGGDHETRKYIGCKQRRKDAWRARSRCATCIARTVASKVGLRTISRFFGLMVMDVFRLDSVRSLHRRQATDRGQCHA